MRLLLPCLLLLLLSRLEGFAQKTVKGYYLTLNNDSIPALFKLPIVSSSSVNRQLVEYLNFSNLKDEVKMVDSKGEIHRLTPANIRGFAFTIGSRQYHLHSKPITEYRRNFLRPQIIGKKVRLYHYTLGHSGHPAGFGHKTSSPGWKEYFWTFEKPGQSYLFLNSRMRKREMARMLKEFFNDDPQIQEFVDGELRGFIVDTPKAIESIVKYYNGIE
jgi:hypothetical protein